MCCCSEISASPQHRLSEGRANNVHRFNRPAALRQSVSQSVTVPSALISHHRGRFSSLPIGELSSCDLTFSAQPIQVSRRTARLSGLLPLRLKPPSAVQPLQDWIQRTRLETCHFAEIVTVIPGGRLLEEGPNNG